MTTDSTVRIALLLPDLLGTYGDRGNAVVLSQRLKWRGYAAEIDTVLSSATAVPGSCDVYLIGGGEDVAQQAAVRMLTRSDGLQRAAAAGAPVLGICGGLQVLGTRFTTGDGSHHDGLGLLDVVTEPGRQRAIGEISTHATPPGVGLLTGFENHLGRSTLGSDAQPLGHLATGIGNGDQRTEGVVNGHVIGTYLHGPVLARNPALADTLLSWALGEPLAELPEFAELSALRAERTRARS